MAMTLLAAMSLVLGACGDEVEGGEEGGKHTASISGVAQKGQFIKGSSVTIYAMDNNLSATGLSYPTQTTDDMGTFTVDNVSADFIDIKANGYYYNENRGETSKSTINLQAVAATGSHVNVNLLTTLAYNRIKYLVKAGTKFADAQSRAQIEVLTALGLGNTASADFTDMNIAGSGDANGLLLAASLLIQQDRSVGDVSKLISDIAADLEEDGMLSSDLNEEIHRNEHNIYVGDVISGLIDFYGKNKVTDFSIPTFYKFLDTDGDGKMDGAEGDIFKNIDADEVWADVPANPNIGFDAGGFSLSPMFLSTIPFQAKSDAEWLTAKVSTITENIYTVDIAGQPNTGENRTGHITYTDESGKELATYTYQQKAPDALVPQRIFLAYTYDNVEIFNTDHIGVNGKEYEVSTLSYDYLRGYNRYVDIPSTDKQEQYQAYFPVSMVSMPDGYGTYRLTIPKEITSGEFPFVGQRENYDYSPIDNPTAILLMPACPHIQFYDIDGRYADHLVLTSDQPLCGTATYTLRNGGVDNSNPQIDEQSTRPDEDGKYRMTITLKNHAVTVFPVLTENARITVQVYDAAGQILYEDRVNSYYSYPTTR